MRMTTPNEFLRFAHEITQTKNSQSITEENSSSNTSKNSTGLLVLNNICHLIDQLHTLKLENHRLRSHLDLIDHVNRFCLKSSPSNPSILCSETFDDEEKSSTLSPSNSFKRTSSINSNKDRLGVDLVNHQEEFRSSHQSIDPDHDGTSMMTTTTTSKIRHAWIFSRGKKKSSSPNFQHLERPIPLISISTDNDPTDLTMKPHHQTNKNQRFLLQYGNKLRSKFSPTKRPLNETNHLAAQFASAMTKSYQKKMREWQSLQKSDFLINYRRQSVTHPTSFVSSKMFHLSPILSPYQRSLILYQWREIMSEEISLRHGQQILQETIIKFQRLETQLKTLKTQIFATNDSQLRHQSMTSLDQLDREIITSSSTFVSVQFPRRSRSLQSFISIPTSWLLAVQSAAYSDILDGTTEKTTENTMHLKRSFFQQLEQFKEERQSLEQNLIKDLQLKSSMLTKKPVHRLILTRAHLHRPIDVLNLPEVDPPLQCTLTDSRSRMIRFDLRKTLQRSRSLCLSQLHSWLDRYRRNHQTTGTKESTRTIENRHHCRETIRAVTPPDLLPLNSFPDDSDIDFHYRELPIKIYFPAQTIRTVSPKIEPKHQLTTPPMSKLTSPILHRRQCQQLCLDI